MKIIDFKEVNVTYAEDQVEYLSLPVYKRDDGEITCCWKLSFWEKVKVLFTGCLWLSILTFNFPLQPIKLSVHKPDDMEEENR